MAPGHQPDPATVGERLAIALARVDLEVANIGKFAVGFGVSLLPARACGLMIALSHDGLL